MTPERRKTNEVSLEFTQLSTQRHILDPSTGREKPHESTNLAEAVETSPGRLRHLNQAGKSTGKMGATKKECQKSARGFPSIFAESEAASV